MFGFRCWFSFSDKKKVNVWKSDLRIPIFPSLIHLAEREIEIAVDPRKTWGLEEPTPMQLKIPRYILTPSKLSYPLVFIGDWFQEPREYPNPQWLKSPTQSDADHCSQPSSATTRSRWWERPRHSFLKPACQGAHAVHTCVVQGPTVSNERVVLEYFY